MAEVLADHVRRVWAALADVPVASFTPRTVRPVVSPGSLLCPPGWVGIVVVEDDVLVTVPSAAVAAQVAGALCDLPGDEPPGGHPLVGDPLVGDPLGRLLDPLALCALLPVAEVLGPTWLSYLGPHDLRRGTRGRARFATRRIHRVERLPPGHPDVRRLREGVSADEARESGLERVTSDAFVVRESGEVVAAAGHRRWAGDVAHLSVLSAEPARGHGLATTTARAAVHDALRQHLLPQWRARVHPSRRIAARLGFRELGRQLSFRLDADTGPTRGRHGAGVNLRPRRS